MATTEEWRKQFAKYKADVKKRGKPFFPYAMFHDTVMSLVVVSVIIGLAAVWYFTSGEDPKTCGSGDSCLLGPRYSEPADPGTTNFVPRPDWYFYFLFYLLRIFKWPDSVILGTVGIPTILLIIALLLPFIDRRHGAPAHAPPGCGDRRRPGRHLDGCPDVQGRDREGGPRQRGRAGRAHVGDSVRASPTIRTPSPGPRSSRAPAALPAIPTSAPAAPTSAHRTSSAIGKSGQGPDFFSKYVADPSKYGNNVMPKFASLGRAEAASARRVPERIQRPEIGPRCASSWA